MNIQIGFLWKIEQNNKTVVIDPLLFDLLVAIKLLGSLQQAALHCQVSYRHIWGMMEKWHKLLGSPLLTKERGRGTRVTQLGEKLIQAHQQLHARYAPQLANHATELTHQILEFQQLQKSDHLKIFASHGLAVSALRDTLKHLPDLSVEVHFHGSSQSLRELQANQCDVAGFHLPEGELGKNISTEYLRYINPQQYQLIYLARRLQGLIVAKGNPLSIYSLTDLTKSNCRFINRQTKSGTRILFEQLLDHHQIDREQISGFHQEEYTHMAVAAMVASDAYDCGFGIAATAEKFGLDFIPIQWEHYCLALNLKKANAEPIKILLECLKSELYLKTLTGIDGYEMGRCGQEVSFNSIFEFS